jgi:hypothetical protein
MGSMTYTGPNDLEGVLECEDVEHSSSVES